MRNNSNYHISIRHKHNLKRRTRWKLIFLVSSVSSSFFLIFFKYIKVSTEELKRLVLLPCHLVGQPHQTNTATSAFTNTTLCVPEYTVTRPTHFTLVVAGSVPCRRLFLSSLEWHLWNGDHVQQHTGDQRGEARRKGNGVRNS